MRLRPDSREYAKWSFTTEPPPDGITLEASVDAGASWVRFERPDPRTLRLLVAGPRATANPPSTVVLPAGRTYVVGRVNDTPELVVFDAGTIDVG